ncbi:hypothetical protein GEMRC1_009695 [Eukaryota sp. GEM-RC1]
MLHNAVDTTTQQFDVVLLTKFIIQQLTNNGHCRYFIAPVINNTGTKGYHWGLLIIDCQHTKWLFIDPNYDTNDFYLDEENVECPSGSFNVFLSTVHSALSVLEYRPIIVPVTQKQTPNDCGVYVLEYIRIFVHALNFRNIDNVSAVIDELQNANKYIDAGSVRETIINFFVQSTVTTVDHPESRKSKPREPSGATPAKRKSKISPASPLPPTVLKPVPVTPIRVSKKIRTTDPLSQSGLTPQTRKQRIVSESKQTMPSQSPPSIPEVQPEQEPNQSQKFCLIEIKSVISDPERLNLKVVRVKQEPEVDEEIESTSEGIPQIQDTTFEIQRDPDLDPIVSISLQFTHDKFANETHLFTHNVSEISLPNCVVHTFTTEKSMLTNFITFLNLNKPSLLISYDWHLDTFPFFVSRCKKLEIDIDYTIDDYISSLPSWFHRWCKPTEIGPFYSLDLNSVLKKLYVFRRGRFLENVTTIMMDMNNHSRTFESFDKENIFLKRIFHSLDNPLVSDEEMKVKTEERQKKAPSVKLKPKAVMEIRLLAELTKLNELWESKTSRTTSRATLLSNSINKLFLIQYILFDLLDEKKQKLRERPPMKAVKND